MNALWSILLGISILTSEVVTNPAKRDVEVPRADTPTGDVEGDVRLADVFHTNHSWSGRVEIFHDGQWGTVCDDGVNEQDAEITCVGLGYDIGTVRLDVPAGSGPIWLDNLDCDYPHAQFTDCTSDAWGVHDCQHVEDFGVTCRSGPDAEGHVRLMGDREQSSNGWSGRVEIFHAGQWGSICDDNMNYEDAEIICRGLGYSEGTVLRNVPEGTGPIWMDQIDCDAPHLRLADCFHNGWGNHDCSHREDFGVTCSSFTVIPPTQEPDSTRDGDVRLVGGAQTKNRWSGRVEIYHDGIWGTVCNDDFRQQNYDTICRGLGYTLGREHTPTRGTGTIWMDAVWCTDDDAGLRECNHQGWGRHDCTHAQDVGVSCEGALEHPPGYATATEGPISPIPDASGSSDTGLSEGDVRLVEGTESKNSLSGRVEVYHDGQWGTVCDDWLDSEDFNTICRGLGYTSGQKHRVAPGSGPIWMDGVNCEESDNRLYDCERNNWGEHDCSHAEDAGVLCVGVATDDELDKLSTEGKVRLVGGQKTSNSWSGRVEIFHDGLWGTVCDDWINSQDLSIICRGLGYSSGQTFEATPGKGPIWMDSVNCDDDHAHLFQCDHNGWGNHDCDHTEDVGVLCVGQF